MGYSVMAVDALVFLQQKWIKSELKPLDRTGKDLEEPMDVKNERIREVKQTMEELKIRLGHHDVGENDLQIPPEV
jgi:hypothetical protein